MFGFWKNQVAAEQLSLLFFAAEESVVLLAFFSPVLFPFSVAVDFFAGPELLHDALL